MVSPQNENFNNRISIINKNRIKINTQWVTKQTNFVKDELTNNTFNL